MKTVKIVEVPKNLEEMPGFLQYCLERDNMNPWCEITKNMKRLNHRKLFSQEFRKVEWDGASLETIWGEYGWETNLTNEGGQELHLPYENPTWDRHLAVLNHFYGLCRLFKVGDEYNTR